MANIKKIVLGKTPEEIEAEEAKKARELELEIQEKIRVRQEKIIELHKKQKQQKIIIVSIICVFSAALLTFGTYNTFFKQGLKLNDVNVAIARATSAGNYPSEGLDNYIRDNCGTLFDKYSSISPKQAKNIYSIEVDKNSCYIFKVKKLSSSLAQVYFSVDVVTTTVDTVVKDETILRQLQRQGFDVTKQPIDDTSPETPPEESLDDPNIIYDEDDPELNSSSTNDDKKESQKPEKEEYYINSKGTIMKRGSVTKERYNFYIPVERHIEYDGDVAVTSGYRAAGDMNLYTLNETDQVDFSTITVHDVFEFNKDAKIETEQANPMKIKVDKTLRDLYEMYDTSQDFLNYRTFNNYNAKYMGIVAFEAYTEPNHLGYNTKVSYEISTEQGFTYQLETYMFLEESGNSWVIKQIM